MKKYFEDRSCEGKIRFISKVAAQQEIKGLLKRESRRTRGAAPYRCPFCFAWHIGHPPGFGRRLSGEVRRSGEKS